MNEKNPFKISSPFTPDQDRVANQIATGPRGKVNLPFQIFLNSPILAEKVSEVGTHIRFSSTLPADIREIAILVTAHIRGCPYEWNAHRVHALRAGVSEQLINQIAEGSKINDATAIERAVVDFCVELNSKNSVSSERRAEVLELLSVEWVTDLIGVCGYYTLLAMAINVAAN